MPIQKILLVDDEPDIRKVGRISLARIGNYQVVEACSGAQALGIAASERPDVILLDVMMPEMDGPTTFANLRSDPTTSGIPVIFMTAKAQMHEVAAIRALGATGVIAKPFDPRTLPAEVARLVAAGAA